MTEQTPRTTPNAEATEAWDGVLFDKFVRFRTVLTKGLGLHGAAALEAHPVPEGARVLDVGCGFGDATLLLAAAVGPRGEAVGVDCSPRFVESGRREAVERGASNARFEVADVQVDPLGGPYDYVYSRFGTMFFANPVQAFRNVRASMKGGAKLVSTVWRRREDNPCMHEAQLVAEAIVPPPAHTDAPTCGPGPFSLAGADVMTDILVKAGFRRPTVERCDRRMCIGADVEEALQFALELGPAGELLRLAAEDGEKRRPELEAALRRMLTPHAGPEGVLMESSTWIVTAIA